MTTPQTWLITGASSGLGLALTRHVLAAGHHVVATTRQATLSVEHPHLTVVSLDPSDRAACVRAVAAAAAVTGRVDVLVNNAGYGLVGAIEEVTEADARAILDVHVLALDTGSRSWPRADRSDPCARVVMVALPCVAPCRHPR